MASANQLSLVAVPRDPTSPEIAKFIATRTGDQMVQLIDALPPVAHQRLLVGSLSRADPAVSSPTVAPKKAKKAVNAFMAHRCFYILIPAFKPWPMKKLSGLLSKLWDADPNHTLWTLLAKAWSMIRDQIGNKKAPFYKFLQCCCPALGLPEQGDYLKRFGWSLVVDEDGEPTLVRDFFPPMESLEATKLSSTLSVNDIFNHCHREGFAQEFDPDAATAASIFQVQVKRPYKNTAEALQAMHQKQLVRQNFRRARRQQLGDYLKSTVDPDWEEGLHDGNSLVLPPVPLLELVMEPFSAPVAGATTNSILEGSMEPALMDDAEFLGGSMKPALMDDAEFKWWLDSGFFDNAQLLNTQMYESTSLWAAEHGATVPTNNTN